MHVICSEIAEKVFQSFSKFMETKIGVSTTRSSRNSKGMPLVALCVQHDDTKKEIQKLQSLIGKNNLFLMIEETPYITFQSFNNEQEKIKNNDQSHQCDKENRRRANTHT